MPKSFFQTAVEKENVSDRHGVFLFHRVCHLLVSNGEDPQQQPETKGATNHGDQASSADSKKKRGSVQWPSLFTTINVLAADSSVQT